MQTVRERNFVIAGRNHGKLNWIPALAVVRQAHHPEQSRRGIQISCRFFCPSLKGQSCLFSLSKTKYQINYKPGKGHGGDNPPQGFFARRTEIFLGHINYSPDGGQKERHAQTHKYDDCFQTHKCKCLKCSNPPEVYPPMAGGQECLNCLILQGRSRVKDVNHFIKITRVQLFRRSAIFKIVFT